MSRRLIAAIAALAVAGVISPALPAHAQPVADAPQSQLRELRVPDRPSGVTATPAPNAAITSWAAPVSDGGSAITGYQATARDAFMETFSCTTSGATTCTITGLTNERPYSVTVTATNAVGTSASSDVVTVTPVGTLRVGGLPAIVRPGSNLTAYVSGGDPGCLVSAELHETEYAGTVGADGTARLRMVAPQPNSHFALRVRQSGPGCPGQEAWAEFDVVGPWIYVPDTARRGRTVFLECLLFAAKKPVNWTISRNGRQIAEKTTRTDGEGYAIFGFPFPRTGTYTVVASRPGQRSTTTILIR